MVTYRCNNFWFWRRCPSVCPYAAPQYNQVCGACAAARSLFGGKLHGQSGVVREIKILRQQNTKSIYIFTEYVEKRQEKEEKEREKRKTR